ncbi:MAG: DUF4384 domain-containing protein [Gemmatimonadota bacterium]|nr:MAG: DUF4384 domain-containing protein [Gemmatimonadota bacterium]
MTSAMVVLTLSLTGVAAAGVPAGRTAPDVRVPTHGPYIEVWASGEVFRRGERVHVWFRSAEDAFVTVMRIDTDGRVRVLYPQQPWHNNYVPAGHRLEVSTVARGRQPYAFEIDDYPGTGYLFAVSSRVPFDYGLFVDGDRWDYRNIAYYGRVTGDPYVALMDLIDHMVPPAGYDEYTYDVYPYHVDDRYDYPRFLCYDCHAYVAYPAWNPYLHSCVRYRLVVYDDPYYYPARVYAATRVVFTRPRRVEARYVFQSRSPDESFITKVPRRPVNPTGRRIASREATGRDVGGLGTVPAPARQPARVAESPRRQVTQNAAPGARAPITFRRGGTSPLPSPVTVRPKLERRVQPQPVVRRAVPPQAKPEPAKPAAQAAPKKPKKKVKPDSGSGGPRRPVA